MDTEVCRKVTSFLFGTDDDLTGYEWGGKWWAGGVEAEKPCLPVLEDSKRVRSGLQVWIQATILLPRRRR